MLNEHEARVECAARILREHITKAQSGTLPVDGEIKSWIDFTVNHRNAGYNDGYVAGLKTALDVIIGVFDLEATEAVSA